MATAPANNPEVYVKDDSGKYATPQPLGVLVKAGNNLLIVDPATGKLHVQVQTPEFARIVYFDGTDINAATVFDTVQPPVTNDDALKNDPDNLYQGEDGKLYTSTGTVYVSYNAPAATEWNLAGTNSDAGSNKVTRIWRKGAIMVGDGVDSTTNFNGYFLARGDFTNNPNIFDFQNTRVLGTGFKLNNGAGPGQFLPGMVFTPSGALRSILAVNVLEDFGFQEPGMQIRAGKGTGGLTSLTSRPSFEVLNGLRVDLRLTAPGNLLVGTTANPGQERIVSNGAIKMVPDAAYATAVPEATTPVPNGGAGTTVFAGGRFLGWNGSKWKALDN
jgi:hypothetical protein